MTALKVQQNLQHLVVNDPTIEVANRRGYTANRAQLSPSMFQYLQHLTFLELNGMHLFPYDTEAPQGLRSITRLRCLRLALGPSSWKAIFPSSMLTGMRQLTQLELDSALKLELDALAHLPQLQHLSVQVGDRGSENSYVESAHSQNDAAELSELRHLTQLTHLSLWFRGRHPMEPAALTAYSALTASSRLQRLELRANNTIPTDAWKYLLTTRHQLPHLQVLLDIARPGNVQSLAHCAPDISWCCTDVARLVACCPSLRKLAACAQCSPQQLAQLVHFTGLQELTVGLGDSWRGDDLPDQPLGVMDALAQLTALQGLTLLTAEAGGSLESVLRLTRLQQLRSLTVTQGYQDRLRVSGFGDSCGMVISSVIFVS
jgi:hypothetical protein